MISAIELNMASAVSVIVRSSCLKTTELAILNMSKRSAEVDPHCHRRYHCLLHWQHRGSAPITGTQIIVSNLNVDVTEEDMQELFKLAGKVKHRSKQGPNFPVVFKRFCWSQAQTRCADSTLLDLIHPSSHVKHLLL
jgi:hypothetical protein